MIKLKQYINFKLTKADKEQLLALDKRYGDLIRLCNESRNLKIIKNLDEEWERFEQAYNAGIPYIPQLDYEKPITIKENRVIEKLTQLKFEFSRFDCYLSKYYIQNINEQLQLMKHTVDVLDGKKALLIMPKDSLENYECALRLLKENPYEDSPDTKDIDGDDAAEEIQDYIDDKGFDWEVVLDKNMLPRMGVSADKEFLVNPERSFSKADMAGLKAHEVDSHVARRYYGLKTGLRLFQYGLPGRMVLDEGLAVWNSLNKAELIKPNVMFNIAFKSAIAYHINDMKFMDLIEFAKQIAPNYPLRKIFKCIVRIKGDTINLNDLGGRNLCGNYLKGYLLIDKMTNKERDDVLKYNIGSDQITDLPQIKQFLKINKFKSLI